MKTHETPGSQFDMNAFNTEIKSVLEKMDVMKSQIAINEANIEKVVLDKATMDIQRIENEIRILRDSGIQVRDLKLISKTLSNHMKVAFLERRNLAALSEEKGYTELATELKDGDFLAAQTIIMDMKKGSAKDSTMFPIFEEGFIKMLKAVQKVESFIPSMLLSEIIKLEEELGFVTVTKNKDSKLAAQMVMSKDLSLNAMLELEHSIYDIITKNAANMLNQQLNEVIESTPSLFEYFQNKENVFGSEPQNDTEQPYYGLKR